MGTTWTDQTGNLWLFGGVGLGYNSTAFSDYLNDLWQYNISSNEWIWVKGGNVPKQPGIYGNQGLPFVLNTPGSHMGSMGWIDASGDLWLFGGLGYHTNTTSGNGYLNDVLKFGACSTQSILAAAHTNSACAGSAVQLTATGATSFSWSTSQSGQTITVFPNSNTSYTVYSTDLTGCGNYTIMNLSILPQPTLTVSSSNAMACEGDLIQLAATGAQTFTWSNIGTGNTINVIATNALYTVAGSDENGCENTALLRNRLASVQRYTKTN